MQNWGRNNSRFLLIHQQKKFLNSSFLGFTFRFSAICWMMNSTQFRFVIWFQFAIRVENIFLFTGKTIFFLGNFSCRRLFIILIIIYFFTLKIRQTFIVVSANFLSVFLFLISIVFSSISKQKWKIKIFFVIRIELTSLQRNSYQLMLWIHWFR